MKKRFDFKGKEYSMKFYTKRSSNEINYFISVFYENKRIRKGHFRTFENDLLIVPASSNHNFKLTEHDNDLLYKLKTELLKHI